jgi:hypothetical protein
MILPCGCHHTKGMSATKPGHQESRVCNINCNPSSSPKPEGVQAIREAVQQPDTLKTSLALLLLLLLPQLLTSVGRPTFASIYLLSRN